ncbi:hypothetical protein AC579_3297 [Pseudocercospora musae]|uniref:Uncharacterized protein n=1 Tax=Pseudocercospora musae TaxID=113226 RepID=A0A139I9Z0_9PEZI|nr:hypothetical protein AC579_3297 [Pseudocercospora musae]
MSGAGKYPGGSIGSPLLAKEIGRSGVDGAMPTRKCPFTTRLEQDWFLPFLAGTSAAARLPTHVLGTIAVPST